MYCTLQKIKTLLGRVSILLTMQNTGIIFGNKEMVVFSYDFYVPELGFKVWPPLKEFDRTLHVTHEMGNVVTRPLWWSYGCSNVLHFLCITRPPLHLTNQTPKCQSGANCVWPASMVLMLMLVDSWRPKNKMLNVKCKSKTINVCLIIPSVLFNCKTKLTAIYFSKNISCNFNNIWVTNVNFKQCLF